MQHKKTLLLIIIIIATMLCVGCSNSNSTYVENFKKTYHSDANFYDYCADSDDYLLELNLKNCKIKIVLKKNDGTWSGKMSCIEEETESIPIAIEDDYIVIYSDTIKKVPINTLLLYNFDSEKSTVKRVEPRVIGIPNISEVELDYDKKAIKNYMEVFYESFVSEFKTFQYEDVYFDSIEKFNSALFNEQFAANNSTYHSLRVSFTGDDDHSWNPGYSTFGNICMILSEFAPIAW